MLTGAIEDSFLLTPLYLATGLGLLRLRSWVYTGGLITGATGLYFFLSAILGQKQCDSTVFIGTTLSAVPYLAYYVWLLATLVIRRRSLFAQREALAPRSCTAET